MKKIIYLLIIVALFFIKPLSVHASHIYGMDLTYAHISGNTYSIVLTVYGDCSGPTFSTLQLSSPVIKVYNGATLNGTLNLINQIPTTGVEISPVCPSLLSNTTCTNIASATPGVKKFVYKANYTLGGTSTLWRFRFEGDMGGSFAGRSSTITNVVGASTSQILLEDTLNNTLGGNTSAICGGEPIPYYCVNVATGYNPLATDANGDSLSYQLVTAWDAALGSPVTYQPGYTATLPLAVATGTFSFNPLSGQMNFTPNLTQRSVVLYNIREFVGGVLRGTSQREMSVIVLAGCDNNPPSGVMSAPSSGTVSGGGTNISLCPSSGAFNFRVNPTDADGDSITITSSGLPTGATFTVVNNGSTAPQGTFNWNTTGVAPGIYTFYLTFQDNGCPLTRTQTIAYTITILAAPTNVVNLISPATCLAKAVFTISPGGGFSPYAINVIQGSTTVHTFTGVTGTITDSVVAGTYTVRVYNTNGCYTDTTVTFAAPATPNATVTLNRPLCVGAANGSILVNATSGTSPFLYSIGTGAYSTSNTFSSLSAGVYTLHIKDANGCIKDTTVTLLNPNPILENIYIRKPTCAGFANGRVIIDAYNSVAPYTYAIGSGIYTTNDTFSNLPAGTYTFYVMNGNGCIDDTVLTLTDSAILSGSLAITPVACNGGTATVVVSGVGGFGTPYSYAMGSGSSGPFGTFIVAAGTYTFHVKDAQLCTFDTSITITQPTLIATSYTVSPTTCFGTATGSVVVSASGGIPGYVYAYDAEDFSTSPTLTGLSAGTHILKTMDTNGCLHLDTITVGQPSPVRYDSLRVTLPLCHNSSNGSVIIFASGGTPSYSYAYNTSAYGASSTIGSLSAGTYTLHIKDANNCIKDSVFTLSAPPAVTVAATVTPSTCNTLANGSITLSGGGGVAPYTYAIGSGLYTTTAVFSPLAAGSYILHVKDANNCIKDTSITITNSLAVHTSVLATQPVCFGWANGSLTFNAFGGNSPYRYSLSSGPLESSGVFNLLTAGTYPLTIIDTLGCRLDTSVVLGQPAQLIPNITITRPLCNGDNNGVVVVTGTGGTTPYVYAYNNSSFSSIGTFTGIGAGIDTVYIEDNNGCLSDTVITITQPSILGFAGITITPVSCNGGGDGLVVINPTGGTPSYQYAFDSNPYQTSSTLTGFSAGGHTVYIKDNNGCIADSNINVSQPDALSITGIIITNPTCEGFTDGAFTTLVTGGTVPYTYSLDNSIFQSAAGFTNLGAGSYNVFIKDAKGCLTDSFGIQLIGYPVINYDSIILTAPSCVNVADGTATIYGSGGIAPLSYEMLGAVTQSGLNYFINIPYGIYTARITDSKGCIKDSTFTMPQPDSLTIYAQVVPNDCKGADDGGAIQANVTGGTPPYKYYWSYDSLTTSLISNLPNGFYTVEVKDSNNCTASQVVEVGYDNCCLPSIPNAFSPNGDGKNDYFRLIYKGDAQIIEFSVYNRYGERVYASETNDIGWDGTYKGDSCDLGTYFYYTKFYCGNLKDKVLELKGDVTLVR